MVTKIRIPFSDIPYLSKTDIAYQLLDPELKAFYEYKPTTEEVNRVIQCRGNFNTDRTLLVEVLKDQYANYTKSETAIQVIQQLTDKDCYTVTTAHQPCLMTGPLYIILKAVSTIRAARQMSEVSGKKVVPIFVVGGEDHDFEEVNHFNLFNDRISWNLPNPTGPVGRLRTESLQDIVNSVVERIGDTEYGRSLSEMIVTSHQSGRSYAEAFGHFLHLLFGEYGLIVLSMDDKRFKTAFMDIMLKEIETQFSFATVNDTQRHLEELGYKPQAFVRELNFFYLGNGGRDRILPNEDGTILTIENSDKELSIDGLLKLCKEEPENFSPNVVTRPLYQEYILPNLAYIGGGGELAYWLERKEQFSTAEIHFPMLIRRDSALWIQDRDSRYLDEIGISGNMIFQPADDWIRHFIEKNSGETMNLAPDKQLVIKALDDFARKGGSIDPTLGKSLEAEKVKILKQIDHLESRIYRSLKQKNEQTINKLKRIKEKLFPNNGLMERHDNFIQLYIKHGPNLFSLLMEHLNPFDKCFKILLEKSE